MNQYGIGYYERAARENDSLKSASWSTAMLSRAKTIPSYDKWMGRVKSQELTDEELEARRVEHRSLVDSFAEYKAKKEQSA